jgi:hypothetical protein
MEPMEPTTTSSRMVSVNQFQSNLENKLRLCLRLQLLWAATLVVLHLIEPAFGSLGGEFDIVLFIKHAISLFAGIAALVWISTIREQSFAFTDTRTFRRLYHTNKWLSILVLIQIVADYAQFIWPSGVRQ